METNKHINPNIQRIVGPDLYQLQDEYDLDEDPEYQRELEEMSKMRNIYKNPVDTIAAFKYINVENLDLLALKKVFNIFDGIQMIDEQKEYFDSYGGKKNKDDKSHDSDQHKINDFLKNEDHFLDLRTQIGEFLKNCEADIGSFDHPMFQKLKRILKFLEENVNLQLLNLMSNGFEREFESGKGYREHEKRKKFFKVTCYRDTITS